MRFTFTEELNPIDARSPSAYELRSAGTNGLFDDADDVVFVLSPGYVAGQTTLVLTPSLVTGPLPQGKLPVGNYRITILAGIASSLYDLAGNRLDGDGDRVPGGNYVREFTVIESVSPGVQEVIPTRSGVDFRFNQAMTLDVLNLFDGVDPTVDAADFSFVGQSTGPVRGSLVWNPATSTFSFIKTGGPLLPDTYTVRLVSGPNGFKSTTGEPLDGDRNGVAGGDFVATFQIQSNTQRVVSIPDFARGATQTNGQAVNLSLDPAIPGLPVTISDGAGVLAVDFDVAYNSSLINFTNSFFGVLPDGWTTTVNTISTNRLHISLSGTTPLSTGPQTIARLVASIPANAAYGASDLIRVEDLVVYTQAGGSTPVPSIGDAGLHKVAFVGDTNSDGQYTAQDAGWIAGVVAGVYTGFDAHSWTDPTIEADVNQNGVLDGLDSSWIARKGLSSTLQPEIPNLPAGSIEVHAGVDPTIAADALIPTRRGSTVNVPVRITDNAAGLTGVDVFLDYNTGVLDLPNGLNAGGVALAGMFTTEAGWSIDSFADDTTGKLRLAIYRAIPSVSTVGAIANVEMQVRSDAAYGVTPILVGGYANVPPFSFSFVSGSVNVVNEPVVLTRASASVTGNVLTQLTNTGTWSDPESDAVTLSASLGTVTKNSDGTWSWTYTPTVALLGEVVTISASDGTNVSTTTFSVTAYTTIATRGIQYVGATGTSASTSLATDKRALLPGQTSSFDNYTNYSRGLNGLAIDVVGLPASVTNAQLADSLQFAAWNGIAVSGFVSLPGAAVPTVAIVAGGVAGSTRVQITFPDNTVRNTWLRVTVVANANTGLAANDVFYFGNVIGELDFGNTATRLRVNGQDAALILANQSPGANTAGVTNKFDLDRNGRVNGQDYAILLANQQAAGIVAPITVPSSRPEATRGSLGSRSDSGPGIAVPMPTAGDINKSNKDTSNSPGASAKSTIGAENREILSFESLTGNGFSDKAFLPQGHEASTDVAIIELSGTSTRLAAEKVKEQSLKTLDSVFASLWDSI